MKDMELGIQESGSNWTTVGTIILQVSDLDLSNLPPEIPAAILVHEPLAHDLLRLLAQGLLEGRAQDATDDHMKSLLAHYAGRKPKPFHQFDGFHLGVGGGDDVMIPDDEGDDFWGTYTWELMHGADVRVLIPESTTAEDAQRMLHKIADSLAEKGLWTLPKG